MSINDASSLVSQPSADDTAHSTTSHQAPALRITNLRKSFHGREVVQGMSLEAHSGKITSVLGPNGAGKTTTIECCEGLQNPDSGDIEIFGLNPRTSGDQLRHRVGVMLQDSGLPNSVRALDMLNHVSRMYAQPWDVSDLVERLGIESFARTTVRRLSGGQRQRLALAAALIGRPQLLFLDEPSAGMDPQSRHAVWELIRELRDGGAAILLTTHLMDEAETLSDQVYIVDNGQVIASGSPSELASGTHQQLTFRTDIELDLERLAAAIPASITVTSLSSRHYRIMGDVGPEVVASLATFCMHEGALLTQLSAGAKNLEDVFLDLTGRSLR